MNHQERLSFMLKQLSTIILLKFPMPSSGSFPGEGVYGIRIYLKQLDTSGKYVSLKVSAE